MVFGLIVLTLAIAPDYPPNLRAHAGSAAASMGFVVAVFYLFIGLILLRKAHVWAGRAGPVQRLVTHARGRAYGFLAAVACQLGIVMALLFAK
jgi:peroxiredoxin family protein